LRRRMLRKPIIVLLLMSMVATPVLATNQGEGEGQEFPPPFLEGNRINILSGIDLALPADEPCFVIHGWISPNWQDATPEEKSNIRYECFELEIDGVSMDLRKFRHYYKTYLIYEDVMFVWFYVQFEADHFEAGETYRFRGIWVGQEGPTIEIQVTFTTG